MHTLRSVLWGYRARSLDVKWIWRQFFTLMMLDYHVYVCLIIDLHKLEIWVFFNLTILVEAWEEMYYYTWIALSKVL